jgi:hypothetical protein
MSKINIEIGLDTGDLVSGAERGKRAIAGLTDEMKKARKEDRLEDYERLRSDRTRLQNKTSGLEKDIKAVAKDPRFQTTSSNGETVLKIDPEYANALKSHSEAIGKYTDDLQGALGAGDMGKVRELTLQIEKQQYETQKTLKDIINTGGNFPQTPPLNNDTTDDRKNSRAPSLPDNGDWRELKGLSGAITQEHDVDNWEQVARLGTAKDTLRGIMGQYDRDSKLEAKVKADPEFASQLKEIRDALKGTITAIDEAAANRDYEKVEQLTGRAKQLQGISHKTIGENMPAGGAKAASNALLQAMSIQQITGAVNNGIQTYVAHLDRSGIVNAMGGGDVIGAKIEELRREGAKESGIGGSVGSIAGAGAGALLSLIPGAQAFAPLLVSGGATLGNFAGGLFGIDENIEANKMATSEAYSKLWEQQAPAAMELTGLLGKYGGTKEGNTWNIRRTYENAANTATEYGFSPEEGMEQVKQAAYQGLNEGQALDAARDVFAFERGTGADRGVLSEFRYRTGRFGIADGLNTAWQGNQASGMAPGQFNEFLRSMQKTFEDGISKGFVRGADEIAGNLSFLSDLNGGSELWKGELGANRLATMNSGLEATTALSSASDILSFRGAQNLLKQWDAKGDADERWKAIGDLDHNKENGLELRRGYDYIDSMAILERGLTPELFHTQMQMIEGVEGKGNRTGAVEQMKNIYGLNYTGSAALYQTYQDKLKTFKGDSAAADKYFSGDEWAKKLEDFKANPDNNDSTERTMLEHVADIKKYTYEIGQWHLDRKIPEIEEALKTAWAEAVAKGVTTDTDAGEHGDPDAPPKPPEPMDNPYPPKPTEVERTLDELTEVATAYPSPGGAPIGDAIRTAQNNAIEAQVNEEKRQADAERMLTKNAEAFWDKKATFFTEKFDWGGPDDPDETAYKNLQSFGKAPEGSAAYNNYWKSIGIMETFTDTERKYVNDNNSINAAVNNAMTDATGQRLVELLTELRDNTKEIFVNSP